MSAGRHHLRSLPAPAGEPVAPAPSPERVSRLVLVDTAVAMRDALAGRLSRGGVQVVATEASAKLAISTVRDTRPDLVIVDAWLDDASGVELVERLEALDPRPRTLLYTADRDLLTLHRALRAGANGYALKTADVDELRWAIEYVLAGNPYIDPRLSPLLSSRTFLGSGELAPRERETLSLIAAGLSQAEIAERLGLGEETIRTHAERAKRKLNARNRAHAVALAVDQGLITVDGPEHAGRRLKRVA